MAEIQLDNISKRFADGTEAVTDISFTVHDSEFFILLGPSGCGKSTLLNIIVGLEPATSGEVRVNGRPINHLDPRERNMAMVFQSYAIYPHMSVRENLAFPLKLAGMKREEIESRVQRAASALELTELLQRMPRSLSGGQRQRVAMGRAIVRQPDAFLLDEPLSNLDAKLRSQMRSEIARLQEQLGTTMIYVTHDQTEAITLGHRLAVLRRGRLQQVGSPREVYNSPANLFVAGFIGSPAMNFLPGRVQRGRLQLPIIKNEVDLPGYEGKAEERPVLVGFRPEHLDLAGEGRPDMLFSATVTMVEWLGADALVHFELEGGGDELTGPLPEELHKAITKEGRVEGVVRLAPSHRLCRGDALRLGLSKKKIHLFDPDSGDRLPSTSKQKDMPFMPPGISTGT